MHSEEEIVEQLSRCGLRVTRARRAIARALMQAGRALTPAQTCELARRHAPGVGLVTTYRTLELLTQLGFARRIHSEDGCHSYVRATCGHRHDLICQGCGRVVEFEGCDLSDLLARVESETGFTVQQHMLELAGLCPRCRDAAERDTL